MDEATEQKSLVKVIADLRERFPDVPTEVIGKFVEDAYLEFAGAPVRDYIPVMVERVVKNRIFATTRRDTDQST